MSSAFGRCICGDFPAPNVQIVSVFQTFLGIPCFNPNPCDFPDLAQDQSEILTFTELLQFLSQIQEASEDMGAFQDIAEVAVVLEPSPGVG